MSYNPNPPEGYQTVMPYLILKNALEFFSFTERVFGAREKMKVLDDERGLVHGEIVIGGSTIMIGGSTDQWQPQPAGLYVNVEDSDRTYQTALDAGATSVMEPSDQEYGRASGVLDPFGNTWWIISPIKPNS